MRIFLLILAFVSLILYGCIGEQAKENCYNDCLRDAFRNCTPVSGTWNGDNGDINVSILGKGKEGCRVAVTIAESDLNITGKSMTCEVPMSDNSTFSIRSNCVGELGVALS